MPRYFLHLSYNGAPFHGWQTQPGDISVQQTIEQALSTLARRPIAIVGAGRTDTGVNARMMMAHVDLDADLTADPQRLLRSLNSLCGPDIALLDLIPVADDAHARFDATSRTYRYFVHHTKSPFINRFSLLTRPLDYDAMNAAAKQLTEMTDFTSFAKLHSDARTNICHVSRAQWVDMGHGRYYFEITADRFLRNMVRAVVGTLLDVGRHKLSIEGFANVATERNRCAAGTSVPGYPLFLWDITYPYIPADSAKL